MSDTDQPGDEQARDFAKALFGTAEPAEPGDEQQKPPGYVAKEGNTPQRPTDHDAEMREFTRELFDRGPA